MAHVLAHAGPKRPPGFYNESNYLFSDGIHTETGWDADGAPVD